MPHRTSAAALLLFAACSSDPAPVPPEDLCDPTVVARAVAGGSAQLGLGDTSAPVPDGQPVPLVCGTQGGTMFLVNARAEGLDITPEQVGAVDFIAALPNGTNLTAVSVGCRVRTFDQAADGSVVLHGAYGLQIDPIALRQMSLDGATVVITAKVRDHLGVQATDTHSVIAQLPGPCAGG